MIELDGTELRNGLVGTLFEGFLELPERVSSTIDVCAEWAREGAPEGTVVIAASQSGGRGQKGRRWFSPAGGGLYLSALIRPPLAPSDAPVLTHVAAVAACRLLQEDVGLDGARVKLPNDLVVPAGGPEGPSWKKIGGLLVDTAVQGDELRHAIVSFGLNVAIDRAELPAPIRDLATCVRHESGAGWTRERLAIAFLRRLSELRRELDDTGAAPWIDQVREQHARLAIDLPDFRLPELEAT